MRRIDLIHQLVAEAKGIPLALVPEMSQMSLRTLEVTGEGAEVSDMFEDIPDEEAEQVLAACRANREATLAWLTARGFIHREEIE